jgi:uncharacterized membrane protein (UPF0127 family)
MKRARLIHRGEATRVALDVAEHALERMRGLLGRSCLDATQALWLEPCNAVHTFGMRFPIDVVFIDDRNRVLAIHRNVQRARILFCWRARSVLEMNANAAHVCGIGIGDKLAWRPLP